MNEQVRLSRQIISRRRALGLGGTIGLGGLLAACGANGDSRAAGATYPAASRSVAETASTTATSDIVAALDEVQTCSLGVEETQGPYWFDVDSIRSDLRGDRPGTTLTLAARVQGGGPGGGSDDSFGETSDGSYSVGDQEATTTDEATYLRGAQVADTNGVVQFTTIVPGWYRGRTAHVHLKVHIDKATVLTTQLYFDDDFITAAYAVAPYADHTGQDTFNSNDSIFDPAGLLTIQERGDGYLGLINLGVDV